jgi:hypothetical protein
VLRVDLCIYAFIIADRLIGLAVDRAEAAVADLTGFTGFIASAAVL